MVMKLSLSIYVQSVIKTLNSPVGNEAHS